MNRALPVAFVALVMLNVGRDGYSHAENQPASTRTTPVATTRSQTTIDSTQEERFAKAWGLKREEWTRYRELMRGPLGIYSPSIDPLTALGIEARSDDERRRYAQMQVRAEGARVKKLFAYQRAYDEAWKRLYPTLPRVALTQKPAENPPRSDAQLSWPNGPLPLAVFVRADCSRCDAQVRALQTAGRTFDIYMVGTRGDDAAIRAWASRAGVDPRKVKERVVTLNHDGGRWASVGDGGALPAVLREVNGRWQRD